MNIWVRCLVLAGTLISSACNGQVETVPAGEVENTGPWALSADESGLTYLSVKNGNIAEINTFRAMDGKVSTDGAAEFTIVLDSVDTNNEIRDPRMRQYLFETDKHPFAIVSAQLDMAKLTDLGIGVRHTELLDMTLDFHGVTDERQFYVMVTRLGANRVLVENKAPLILEASDFGLEAGIEKLRDLAGLETITPVVPITFSLVFERK
jgi:hypothetical protein